MSLPAVGQTIDEGAKSLCITPCLFCQERTYGCLREAIKISGLVSVIIIYVLMFLHFYYIFYLY